MNDFISVCELASYGTAGGTVAFAFAAQPTNVTVTAGQRAKFTASPQSTAPMAFQWLKTGSPVAGANASDYATPPTSLSDNASSFTLQVDLGALGLFTSQPAILTVLARTNPPVLAATYDTTNQVIEVWFNGGTDPTSSQTGANYTLNDPAATVTSATQEGQGCGVVLTLSAPLTVASPTVMVANVMDLDGNTMATQTLPLLPLIPGPTNVVANSYQQGRDAALTRSTDGVVVVDANVTTWTTYGSIAGSSDFVGLGYAEPQVFGVVKVDLGYQFGDGGDWSFQPKVFILKNPIDTDQKAPETDLVDWVAVPASDVSGNIFDVNIDQPADSSPLVNSPIVFDLSHLPLSERTGWGWAVGGVQGNGPVAQFVSIAEARAFGVSASSFSSVAGAPQILLDVTPSSVLVPVGSPFTLSVPLVVGTEPLSYQWQHNGANVSDVAGVTGSQTATLKFTAGAVADSGGYRLIVTNTPGSATSAVAQVTVTPIITFNTNGAGWTLNTPTTLPNVPITNNVLTLTDGGLSEARSCFLDSPVFIGHFTASYTFQDIGGAGADGAVFALQNSPLGPIALGGAGGSLGFAGISPSVGLEMDVYAGSTNGIAFRVNGVTGGPYSPTGPVNLAGGNPINCTVAYDGTTATLTMLDAVAGTSFTTNYTADLPSLLGQNTAYVGFTGASGGVASFIQISNFTFANGSAVPPVLFVQPAPGNMVLLSWPMSPSGFTLQQNSALGNPGGWTPVPGSPTPVGGQFQLTVPATNHQEFYRLQQ